MATQVLLVIHDKDTEDLMHELLDEELTKRSIDNTMPIQTWVRSEAEAKQHLTSNQYDLLITQVSIPADRKSPLVEKEMRGFTLLEFVKTEQINLPCIVLAQTFTNRLNMMIKDFKRSELVEAGELLEEDLGKSLDRLLTGANLKSVTEQAGSEEDDIVDVKIMLRDSSTGIYEIIKRGYPSYYNDGDLIIEEKQLNDLLKASRRLAKKNIEYEEWNEELRDIGEKLLEALSKDNEFQYDLGAAAGRHIDKARFFFNVGEVVYPLAFEAIKDPKHRFWMLDAPVMRRLPFPTSRSPLFKDKGTLNRPIKCLIIQSVVEGHVNDNFPKFGHLSNVKEEAEWLESFLKGKEQVKPIVKIDNVERIQEKKVPKGKSFSQYVRKVLMEDRPWHIVHYAGHSYYNDTERKGYVIFPGPRGGKVHGEAVEIETFAQWLRDSTCFVYMSSCHSSESDIVSELARKGVPAIVGFRWDIDDNKAKEHARIFYTDLLSSSRSVEYAFLKARQETYDLYKKDKTWAAPMLILQMWD